MANLSRALVNAYRVLNSSATASRSLTVALFPILRKSSFRGFLELDLVLGKWVEEHICSMDESRIKALVNVLDLENPDLWKWLTGQEQPPEEVSINSVFSAVRDKVMNNLNSQTRALPGPPWVRGWNDIKKNPGSPVAGNQ
ncbi:hypothetical protein P3X46_023591 [Hevea brasiliensis]|uniref:Succinate dehydrogenase assembly factor 2, mitochondrial n=1 Tax=Hevea brasiliensis TaxID=3981 RepID=A0ABQ9LCL3_HEVBR|nr:hypothetical protein P3X46_023591 [Hevea brasiliensis]